jgi:hypothetical protein
LTDAFGLSSFVSPEITREVLKQQVEALEERAPIIFTPQRKRNYSYLKYAAVFTVMLGAGTFGYKMYYDQQILEQTLIVEKKVQEKVQQQIQEATFVLSNPIPSVELALPEEKLPYHLVAGAYRSEENANKAIAELLAAGFDKAKMLPINKHDLYPVVFASFKTLKEAQAERKAIQKSHSAEAWLLID